MTSSLISVRFVLSGLGTVLGKEVPQGTTLRAFCASIDGWAPEGGATHVIVTTVGGDTGPKDLSYVLQEGDEVTLSPRAPKNA